MNLLKSVFSILAMCLIFTSQSEAASGTVILAKGAVTATGTDKVNRVLAKGAGVNEGDIINTAQKSFAVIRMLDKTKLTLKAGTSIVIGAFNDEKGKEEACVNLLKGGLRTVTGLIGKRKPEAFKVDTPIASIGIRGTDFILRVCAGDECLSDEQELSYRDVDTLADSTAGAEPEMPEGFYASCETGIITMSQCAGQASEFEVGKCRVAQQKDCTQVELKAGQAGYTGLLGQTSASGVRILPQVPLILDNDPYFALSDMSDAELDKVDNFPDAFSPQGECSIYGG